jgi:hypothetical protein
MAISIDWPTKVINVPRADLTLIQSNPVEIRELNINAFRLELKGIEASNDGISFLDTHRHNTEVLLGGIVYARVIEIINGYTVTFEDGQYAVNLVGANSNIGDVVNVNQVSVRSANSAGLISNQAIEFSSFNGGVTIDIINGASGTAFPIGTPQRPVGNLLDAHLISVVRGLGTFFVIGDLTLDDTAVFDSHTFVGESLTKSTITVLPIASVIDCEFYDAEVTGTLDGDSLLKECKIRDLNYITGFVERCVLDSGTITLGGSAEAHLIDCYSGIPGVNVPVIDMGGSGTNLAMRNYNGGIQITNKTGPESVSIDMSSGQIKFTNSVTNGTIVCRGVGTITEDLSAGATIINEMLNDTNISSAVWDEDLTTHTTTDSAGWWMRQLLTLKKFIGLQ